MMKFFKCLFVAALFIGIYTSTASSAGKVTPSVVYQTAMTLADTLAEARSAKGLSSIANQSGASGKNPGHVYTRGEELLSALGGSKPARPAKITPVEVLQLLNTTLAAAKGKNGGKEAAEHPFADGKNPNDVYDALSTAIAMTKGL